MTVERMLSERLIVLKHTLTLAYCHVQGIGAFMKVVQLIQGETIMASESVHTGKSIYGGHYAKDSKGNHGYGKTESTAIHALKMAQNKQKK